MRTDWAEDAVRQLRKFNCGRSYTDLRLLGYNIDFLLGPHAIEESHHRMHFEQRGYLYSQYMEDEIQWHTENRSWYYYQETRFLGFQGDDYVPENASQIVLKEEAERKTQAQKIKAALKQSWDNVQPSRKVKRKTSPSSSTPPKKHVKSPNRRVIIQTKPNSTTSEENSSYRNKALEDVAKRIIHVKIEKDKRRKQQTEPEKKPSLSIQKRKIINPKTDDDKQPSPQREQKRRKLIPNTGIMNQTNPYAKMPPSNYNSTKSKKDHQRDRAQQRGHTDHQRRNRPKTLPIPTRKERERQRRTRYETQGTPQITNEDEMDFEEPSPMLEKKARPSVEREFEPIPEAFQTNPGETPLTPMNDLKTSDSKSDEETEPELQGKPTN